jgi:hypothetical protein
MLVTPEGTFPVIRRFGHPFMLWDESLELFINGSLNQNPSSLTDTELRRLHRRFGHLLSSHCESVEGMEIGKIVVKLIYVCNCLCKIVGGALL